MLDSIYHMPLGTTLKSHFFGVKMFRFCHVYATLLLLSLYYVTKNVNNTLCC